jgi:hypothetical protein
LLVALGFHMVGLTQGVRTGLAMWGAQTRRLGETGELDAGARVLRTLLGDIQTLQPSRTGAATTNFEASPDKLTFVGDLPTGFGTDSPLEGDGYELLVPRHKSRGFRQRSGHCGGIRPVTAKAALPRK